MKQRKILTLMAAMLGATALSGCWLTDDKKRDEVTARPDYRVVPVAGDWEDHAAYDVFSVDDGEGPTAQRFSVQFTEDEEIVIVDKDLQKTYTFTADQVNGDSFNELDFMRVFMTSLNNRDQLGPEPDWDDQNAVDAYFANFESVDILTPNANNNRSEYALMRVGSTDGQQWLLLGHPTSTALSGGATFAGGFYSNGGHSDLEILADFDGNADAMMFIVHAPSDINGDPDQSVFGASDIRFRADYDGASNTLSGTNKAITTQGSLFDRAQVQGSFFDAGNASAGLIRLEDTNNVTDDIYGGYHAVRTSNQLPN